MRIASGAFALLVFLIGTVQLYLCIAQSSTAILASRWPTASGKIVSSEVREDRGGRGVAYFPRVRYEFTVDGKSFLGSHIHATDVAEEPSRAREMVDQYPVGQTIRVFYNPDSPTEAVLEPGLSWHSYMWFGFSLFFTVAGAHRFLRLIGKAAD